MTAMRAEPAQQNGTDAPAAQDRPYYQAVGNEEAVFKAAYRQGLSLRPEGADGVRQDPVRRGDGPRPRPAADHRRLP